MPESSSNKTATPDQDTSEYHYLSLYLGALSSEKRLQILRRIDKDAKSIRTITSQIGGSIENTTKHVEILQSIGLVRNGPVKKNSRGQPINTYELVPGSFESILRTLGHFSHVEFDLTPKIKQLEADISKVCPFPYLKILGGDIDGRIFPLTLNTNHEKIKIGRMDPEHPEKFDIDLDIVLGNNFKVVTRVSKPHAQISCIAGNFFIEDCGSTWGTYLNEKKLTRNQLEQLSDNDVIEMGKDVSGAHFLFKLPQTQSHETSG